MRWTATQDQRMGNLSKGGRKEGAMCEVDGESLRKARERARLTRRELATFAGLHPHSLYRLERGMHKMTTCTIITRAALRLGLEAGALIVDAPGEKEGAA